MFFEQAKKTIAAAAAVVAILDLLGFAALGQPVQADTMRMDDGPLATMLNLPVYQWQDTQKRPRAIVLAIHGLTMHGTMFDACARKLAADGDIVIAPDLRGYGAWYNDSKFAPVNYGQSEQDLCALATAVRQRYRGLPVFLSGESLGGSLAIRLAAKHPELIDGLILCAPAIEYYHHSVPAKTVIDAAMALARHGHQLDISDYIKKDFSEDSQITQEEMNDPLIRKHMTVVDLLESCRLIDSTRHYIGKIRSGMPVLVLQGEEDRMVKPSGVTVLKSSLKSANETVRLLPLRGHILIETEHVHDDTMKTITSWVDSQCALYTRQGYVLAGNGNAPHQGG